MADVEFKTYGVEVVNVTNPAYGVVSNPAVDSSAAFQLAIDAAFGPANNPNGPNTWQNRPLYIPHGHYFLATPVTFKNVQGGFIFGDGSNSTTINGGGAACFVTNGLKDTRFERFGIATNFFSTSGAVTLDLDWNGDSGGISALMTGAGLTGNTFQSCSIGSASVNGIAVRIAQTNNVGTNSGSYNRFDGCYMDGGTVNDNTTGILVVSPTARGNVVTECNIAHQNLGGIHIVNGSVTLIAGIGFQNQGYPIGWDIVVDACPDTVVIQGIRSESNRAIKHRGTNAVAAYGYAQGGGHLLRATITNASPGVITTTYPHLHAIGDAVKFTLNTDVGGAALPTQLVQGTTYYIISAGFTASSFQVCATAPGGAAINTSGGNASISNFVSAVSFDLANGTLLLDGCSTGGSAVAPSGSFYSRGSLFVAGTTGVTTANKYIS